VASPTDQARSLNPPEPPSRRSPASRQRWRRVSRRVRWAALAGLWLLGLALGYIGFSKHAAAAAAGLSPLDRFYLTLQLIPLTSGAVAPPVSWELQVARLLLPLVAAYTVVWALALVFVDQVQTFRLRFLHDHTVICGLGRQGRLLATSFLAHGQQVVVVEQREDDSFIQPCRDEGAVVLIGDATDRETLRRAGVHRARHLIASSGDDGANAEIAVNARALSVNRAEHPLTCLVHIVDPQLCNLLRERELAAGEAGGLRLEFFNVYDLGAQALLEEYPFPVEDGRTPPHLLLLGLGSMGRSLVVRAARLWWEIWTATDARLRITVVDREADRRLALLRLRYPRLEKVCELIPVQLDVLGPEFERADFLCAEDGRCRMNAVYICFDNDPLGLAAGLTLLQKIRGQPVAIVVRMASSAGLATLLGQDGTSDGSFTGLHAFPWLDRTCRPDLLLGGTHETLARAIHEEYVRAQTAAGDTPQTNAALFPWDELPEHVKESNRRQADHVGAKLKAVGCGLAPLTDWDAESFSFTPEEVDVMARLEHDRFVRERRSGGWTHVPGLKNLASQTGPDLVPWEALSEGVREKDRNAVRGLPRFLARAGLQIHWLQEAEDAIVPTVPTQ
jgi:hypothetical protein